MPTVSFRISEKLKARLDNLIARAFPNGKYGSGPLLEAVLENGLREHEPFLDPMADQNGALVDIWKRMATNRAPSQKQWELIGHLIHQAFMGGSKRNYVRPEIIADLGQTFARVYELCPDNPNLNGYFMKNIPVNEPARTGGYARSSAEVVKANRAYFEAPSIHVSTNEFYTRNLQVLLRDECDDIPLEALADAFKPAFETIFAVALAGFQTDEKNAVNWPDEVYDDQDALNFSWAKSLNGIHVHLAFLKTSFSMIITFPAPFDCAIAFSNPFEFLQGLDLVLDGQRMTTAKLELYPGLPNADSVSFAYAGLRTSIPKSFIKDWRDLLQDGLSYPGVLHVYRRWRLRAGDV